MIPTKSPTTKTEKMNIPTNPAELSEYLETHHEIVAHLTRTEDEAGTLAEFTRATEGIGGLYILSQNLADQFIEQTAGTDWDGDVFGWHDAIWKFLDDKEREHRASILHENKNFRILLTGTTYAVQYKEDGYIAQHFTTLAEAKKYIGAK